MKPEAGFVGADGAGQGTVTALSIPTRVQFELDVEGLSSDSWHGFQVHETGDCDVNCGFECAGGHFTAADTPHGYFANGGPRAGNVPNQYVGFGRQTEGAGLQPVHVPRGRTTI